MSVYTTELRYICETACGYKESQGYSKIEEIIAGSRASIFDFKYPIFDENYRATLESKIIRHYYLREIGTESVGVFKFFLNRKMNEIMPLYNQYYESALIEFNPLYDMDYRIEHEGSNAGEHEDTEDNAFGANIQLKDTGTNTLANTGTETIAKTGTDTLKDTGTSTLEDTGTKTLKDTGTSTLADTGTKTLADTGTSTLADTGTNTLVIDGTKEESTSEDISVDNTGSRTTTDKFSDTPQGGLSGLQSDTYLTSAKIQDDSTADDSTTDRDLSSTIDNDETQTRTLAELHTTTLNEQHQTTLNEQHQTTLNETHQTTLDVEHKTTLNETHETEYDTEEEKTLNTTNQRTLNETHTTTKAETQDISKSGTFSNTDEYINHIFGKFQGQSYSKLLMEFRETFINIDMMVINELNDLFMGVW